MLSSPRYPPVVYGDYLTWFMTRNYHRTGEQDDIGHAVLAAIETFLAIFGFCDDKPEGFEDMPRNLPNYSGIVNYQTTLHACPCSLIGRL